MDAKLIFSAVTGVVGVFGVGRIIYDFLIGSRFQLREEYKFARDFLKDIGESPMHPYVKEKGYQAIAGTTSIKGAEIEYVLSLEEPVVSLKDYVFSRKYLNPVASNGGVKFQFSKKYQGRWSRWWRKGVWLVAYFIFAYLAITPAILAKQLNLTIPVMLGFLAFTAPLCGFLAFDALKNFVRIIRGERLVRSQKPHTTKIITSKR